MTSCFFSAPSRVSASLLLAAALTMLTGCLSRDETGLAGSKTRTDLQLCKAQLDAIKQVAPEQFGPLQKSFAGLMRNAAQYKQLRTGVTNGTQETVDALYLYRVNLLCADINQTLLLGLSKKGNAE
ncbi:hypothetical protein [Pantoea sp. 1.19]|uniref:hypothetical protein n=1 Tax=Pantoea sp. 1.19 TaxID=1925589 RepID=UPI00094905D3|nr:hypothetical protein [Pantoea sp. 1.19]